MDFSFSFRSAIFGIRKRRHIILCHWVMTHRTLRTSIRYFSRIWLQVWWQCHCVPCRGVSLLSLLCSAVDSYCDRNPSTPGLVTYAPPADDDFRTFGNRETCLLPDTQDLPETSIHIATSAAVLRGVLLFTCFFFLYPRTVHHSRSNGSTSVIGRVRTRVRVVSSAADDDIRMLRTCSVVYDDYSVKDRRVRKRQDTGGRMRNK